MGTLASQKKRQEGQDQKARKVYVVRNKIDQSISCNMEDYNIPADETIGAPELSDLREGRLGEI